MNETVYELIQDKLSKGIRNTRSNRDNGFDKAVLAAKSIVKAVFNEQLSDEYTVIRDRLDRKLIKKVHSNEDKGYNEGILFSKSVVDQFKRK